MLNQKCDLVQLAPLCDLGCLLSLCAVSITPHCINPKTIDQFPNIPSQRKPYPQSKFLTSVDQMIIPKRSTDMS